MGCQAPAFYLAALVPWNYFANATALASNSLVGHAAFLTRIYVPRLIIPTVPCIAGMVDFGIAFFLLVGMTTWYRILPTAALFLLPLLMAVAMLTTLGLGYLLAALNVRFRDIRHAVPFVLQIWMYLTVVLPFSALPESLGAWRYAFGLNPMVGVVEGFRWCLFHPHMDPALRWTDFLGVAVPPFLPLLVLGLPVTLALFTAGIGCFQAMERDFADAV
jgi:lipopolysaccharide transport system permease protein